MPGFSGARPARPSRETPHIHRACQHRVGVVAEEGVEEVPTDITEDVIRSVCQPMGFVNIKVCAVNDVWSGLKLVIRKELR